MDGQEDPTACEPQQEGTGAKGTECCVSMSRADPLCEAHVQEGTETTGASEQLRMGSADPLACRMRGEDQQEAAVVIWPQGKGQGQEKDWIPKTVDYLGGV